MESKKYMVSFCSGRSDSDPIFIETELSEDQIFLSIVASALYAISEGRFDFYFFDRSIPIRNILEYDWQANLKRAKNISQYRTLLKQIKKDVFCVTIYDLSLMYYKRVENDDGELVSAKAVDRVRKNFSAFFSEDDMKTLNNLVAHVKTKTVPEIRKVWVEPYYDMGVDVGIGIPVGGFYDYEQILGSEESEDEMNKKHPAM
jgi:hypothetical protein